MTIKQYLNVVVDQETKGILTRCSTPSVANAVARGIPNSSMMIIEFPFMKHEIVDYQTNINLNYKLLRKLYPQHSDVIPLDSESNVFEVVDETPSGKPFDISPMEASPAWIEQRKIANFKSFAFNDLENRCDRYLARIATFSHDELFYQYLAKELEQVDVDANYYPVGISEWAEINDVSNFAAYQELNMNYQSNGIILMRIHAIWNRYQDLINSISTYEELWKLVYQVETELRFGKR